MTELFAFAGRHPTLSMLFVGIAVAWMMWEVSRMRRGYRGLTTNELSLWINRREATVIDLSGNNDFLKAHIPGALNIQSTDLGDKKGLSRDKPVVVYDRSGLEAPTAAAKLKQLGFSEVAYLDGGLDAWLRESLPVAKGR
jgi:rhodanese-related sulfurtransferase